MDTENFSVVRTLLLVMVFVLLAMTAILFFVRHQFNFGTFVVAIGCLLIYLVTDGKKA